MSKKLPDLLYLTLLHKDFDELLLQHSKDKKYELLKELLPLKQDYFPFSLFAYAADTLNIELIHILTSCIKINCTKLLTEKVKELVDYISLKPNNHFSQESKETLENSAILDRKIFITSIIIDYYFSKKATLIKKGKVDNTIRENEIYYVKLYASCHDRSETNTFIEKHKINIKIFATINFPFRFIDNAIQPTKFFEDKDNVFNTLMSISYVSDNKHDNEIYKAYENLLNCSVTRKIIEYVGSQVQQGNTLKILFNSTTSHYNYFLNHVAIDLSQVNGFCLESLIAHELSHFIMFCLYENECYPFKIHVDTYVTPNSFEDQFKYWQLRPTSTRISLVEINTVKQYHKSNLKILDLARELLGLAMPEPVINSLNEYIEYLKEKSILVLYAIDYEYKIGEIDKAKINNYLKKDLILVIINLLNKEDIGGLISVDKLIDHNGDIIIQYLLEDVLPKINKFYKISESDAFFLTRIADIAIRNQYDRDMEYIVRYPEFAIMDSMGLIDDPRIIDSLEDLKTYWKKEIFEQISIPHMDTQHELVDSC